MKPLYVMLFQSGYLNEATVWWYINVLAYTFDRFSYLPLTLQCVIEILSMICEDLNESVNIACYDEEQIVNSEECSDLDTTSAAMLLDGYIVKIMDTSSMIGNTLQVTIQPSTVKHSIYYYFSSTFEVSVICHCH